MGTRSAWGQAFGRALWLATLPLRSSGTRTMELTRSGWTPMTPSALFHSVCVMFKDGRARVDIDGFASNRDYTEAEARDAFSRVAQDHKWIV